MAWACSDKGTCADGRQCRSTRLCILSGMRRACGRGALRHKDKKFPYSKVIGACDGDTKCAAGSTCVEAKRCVPEPKPKVENVSNIVLSNNYV